MAQRRLLLALALLLGSLAAGPSTAATDQFPVVEGELLTGEALALPDGLPTQRAVVIVAFERAQQKQVDSWVPKLGPIAAGDPQLSVRVVNCMPEDTGGLTRLMAEAAMKTFLPKEKKQITGLTYVQLAAMQKKLGLPDLSGISVFVIDRSGEVRAHVRGAMTPEKLAKLQTILAAGA